MNLENAHETEFSIYKKETGVIRNHILCQRE